MGRKLTKEEQKEYDRLTKDAEQIRLKLDELMNQPVTYGYLRVSSRGQARDGNSLEAQEKALKAAGAEVLYTDVFTGKTTERPELNKLLSELKGGDTLIVTKLDRIARTVRQGTELIDTLVNKGVTVNVLNMGIMDASPTGILIRTIMFAFAEFERNMINERTKEGREIARQNPNHREGRKPYSPERIANAMELLETHSYTEVVKITGISKSTLIRAKKHERTATNNLPSNLKTEKTVKN